MPLTAVKVSACRFDLASWSCHAHTSATAAHPCYAASWHSIMAPTIGVSPTRKVHPTIEGCLMLGQHSTGTGQPVRLLQRYADSTHELRNWAQVWNDQDENDETLAMVVRTGHRSAIGSMLHSNAHATRTLADHVMFKVSHTALLLEVNKSSRTMQRFLLQHKSSPFWQAVVLCLPCNHVPSDIKQCYY